LSALGDDRAAAAVRYELIRGRMIKYFAWERCPYPEDHADEVFDRVARRISEGEQLANPESYFHGVARMLSKEIGSDFKRRAQLLEELGRLSLNVPKPAADLVERKARCLRTCLEKLPPKSRAFILRYYEGDTRTRIEGRQALAEELGIPLNALRNRALRLRGRIEFCVLKCVKRENNP